MISLRRVFRYLVSLIRELSDESAYQRHLAFTGRAHSPQEWRRFSDDRHRRRFQNAKCC